MTSLSTLFGGGGEKDDPRKEGLPCISTWTMNDDNARMYDCVVYNNNGARISNAWSQSNHSSPSNYSGGNIYDKYWGYGGDNGNPYRTNSELSSNSSTYMIKATNYNSHLPLHAMMNVSPTGGFCSNRYTSGNSVMQVIQYMATQVLPEGVRPRCGLTRNGESFYRKPVLNFSQETGGPGAQKMNLWDDSSLVSIFGQNNMSPKNVRSNCNKGKGACGYNERTKTFVLFWRENSDTRCFITRWKLTKNLNDLSVPLREVFETATSVETSSEFQIGYGGSSEQHRFSITVGDNDYIRATGFQDSNRIMTWLLNADLTTPSNFAQTSGEAYLSNTTSYGMEQGWAHIGQTYNSTWDNKWHIHYGHYYYYGCGINGFVTSTEDPRLYYKVSSTGTNDGMSPHAWGRRGFIFNNSQNTDSSDHRVYNLDLSQMKTTTEAYNTAPGKYNSYNEYTQPTNGTTFNLNDYANWFPSHGYNSTNYPVLLAVNWWPNESGTMCYPGGIKNE